MGFFYDVATGQCLNNSECNYNKRLFNNSLCIKICPASYFILTLTDSNGFTGQYCLADCPLYLGFILTDESCAQCPTGQLAYRSDITNATECINNFFCPSGFYKFQKGCFASCPVGTISYSTFVCHSPNSYTDCPAQRPYFITYFPLTWLQYYDYCADATPVNKFGVN